MHIIVTVILVNAKRKHVNLSESENESGRKKGRELTWSSSLMRNKLFEFLFFTAAECIYSGNQDRVKERNCYFKSSSENKEIQDSNILKLASRVGYISTCTKLFY